MGQLSAEQAAMVERAAPRVRIIAIALQRSLPNSRVDELESAGYEGLSKAALRYDPESGVPFSSFAHYRIRGAMLDWARSQAPGLRRHIRALRQLEASQSILEQSATKPTGDRRALEDRVAAARRLVAKAATTVMTSRAMDNEPDDVASADDPEQAVLDRELRYRVENAVASLPNEDQAMISAVYTEGQTMGALAQRQGVATSTVSRRHARVIERLTSLLTDPSP